MLQSFANKESEEIFDGIHTHHLRKKMSDLLIKLAEKKLDMLNCVENLEGLSLIPTIGKGGVVRDAHGKYSMPLQGNWRIAFRWDKEGPADIEIKS